MRHSEKPAGLTLAEALGIEVPADAPGGAKIFPSPSAGAVRSTRGARIANDAEYEGFIDVDGYNRGIDR